MMDSISDLIVRIKNAGDAGKDSLVLTHSKVNFAIASLLEKEGYIKSVSKKGKKITKFMEVELLRQDGEPRIRGVERVSKLSRRMYGKAKEIKTVKHGLGMLVLSTPKGILSDKEAKKENVGGELLFKVW
jgi:small subunit ribosomal protein S8